MAIKTMVLTSGSDPWEKDFGVDEAINGLKEGGACYECVRVQTNSKVISKFLTRGKTFSISDKVGY